MALPRKTKTSNRTATATAQNTSCQSTQQYQKSAKENIDETDDFADGDSPYTDENVSDASPEASQPFQDTSDGALEQLMSNMVDDQRKRLAIKKQKVGKAYNAHRDSIEESITTTFDSHEQDASQAHQAQLNRLQDLLAQKAGIEDAMTKQLAGLQKTYDAHSRDLESVVNRRLNEMK